MIYFIVYSAKNKKKIEKIKNLRKDFGLSQNKLILFRDLARKELKEFSIRLAATLNTGSDFYYIISLCRSCFKSLKSNKPISKNLTFSREIDIIE